MSRSQQEGLPDYLESTLALIQCAFPDGIPSEEYIPLIAVLYADMSQRNLAEVLAFFLDEDYGKTLYDVYDVALGGGYPTDETIIDKVREKLKPCGYDEWLKEMEY